jgi:LysM repeat protein
MSPRPITLIGACSVVVAIALGVAAAAPARATDRVIVVRPGQTLGQIAVEQGVTLESLVALNQIADPDRIFVGQRLRVATAPAAPAGPAAPAAGETGASVIHVVTWGESLTGIAARYGTTIGAIATANSLADPSYIRSGQRLIIPSPESAPTTEPSAPATHIVASGETLSGIAIRYGTSVGAIAAANGLADPSYIRAGQELQIPGGSSGGAAPAATPGQMPAGMAAMVARRDGVRQLIVAEAQRQGVPPAFALAVAWQESGWQQGVVSSAGAIGIMQLIPATGDWVAASMLGAPVDLADAASNVRAGVRLLAHYLARYGGDRSLALAAYYQGQTATDRHGIYPVSRPYIGSILALQRLFGG